MDIGPVLHADDVVAGKMSALFTRAEPRDFLDVDAALRTGRYTREQLLKLAERADAGFDRKILAPASTADYARNQSVTAAAHDMPCAIATSWLMYV